MEKETLKSKITDIVTGIQNREFFLDEAVNLIMKEVDDYGSKENKPCEDVNEKNFMEKISNAKTISDVKYVFFRFMHSCR